MLPLEQEFLIESTLRELQTFDKEELMVYIKQLLHCYIQTDNELIHCLDWIDDLCKVVEELQKEIRQEGIGKR